MFGIPNPLDAASDWFSDASGDVLEKIVERIKDNPELVLVPAVAVGVALIISTSAPAYAISYNAVSGAKDAAEDKEFGHTYTGGIL